MLADRILTHLIRLPGFPSLWHRFPAGALATRIRFGVFDRPHYAWGVYAAADLARRLGLPAVSVAEFGVAGGRGLIALENIAGEISRDTGIRIAVFGFDTGSGMPAATDYRDLPHVWKQGFYKMDQASLRKKLRSARLVIGDVSETVSELLHSADIPPLGFAAFDLDYYSSTKSAFAIFGGQPATRLPRVWCYFDDIMWPETACHNPLPVSSAPFASTTWSTRIQRSARSTCSGICIPCPPPGTTKCMCGTISLIPSIA